MTDNPTFTKDPNAVLDYAIDWTDWLAEPAIDDTIESSSWVLPSGLTKTAESSTTTRATIWLSGGTAGTRYRVTNRIVTAGGRTEDRSIIINCRER